MGFGDKHLIAPEKIPDPKGQFEEILLMVNMALQGDSDHQDRIDMLRRIRARCEESLGYCVERT